MARCERSDIFSLAGAGFCCSTGRHDVSDILQTIFFCFLPVSGNVKQCVPLSPYQHTEVFIERPEEEAEVLTLPIPRNSVLHELFKNSTFNRSCTSLLNDLLLLTVQYQIGHDMWFYFMDSERNVNHLY